MFNDNFGGSADRRSTARILLSGDHPMIRSALGLLIAGDSVVVAGECFNRPDALRRGLSSGADLVLMDFDLDGTQESTALFDSLLSAAGKCPVLILTRGADPKAVSLALYKGVAGVVLKSRPAEVLLRAIRAVLADGIFVERTTMAGVFRLAPPLPVAMKPATLTRRETEIVELVSLGLQNKKIAERLSIRETTVRHHLTSIFGKLALTNRMELMRYAYREAGLPFETAVDRS
jgi:DNA-binding NarL/FixJ family response regulator